MAHYLIIPVIAGLAIGIGFTLVINAAVGGMSSEKLLTGSWACLPASLSEISEKSFPIREPKTELIAPNAELRAIDDHLELGTLYYADFSMCPFDKGPEAMIENGAVQVTIFKPEITLKDSAEFQKQSLDYYTSNPDIIADVQPIEVNGYKGVGWDPYQSQSVVRLNGEIIESTPIPGHGVVRFYHEQDGTIYFITANRSLDEIIEIAKSIQ